MGRGTGSCPTNLLEFGFRRNEKRTHEAQKPLDLIEYLIKLTTREDQIVLDPFMGSGTTAVVAINVNRKFIGFEINQDFYEKSLLRIEEAESENGLEGLPIFQQTLFNANG